MEYGTGAVMAVPTHDQRDFEFAKKYGLPLIIVIQPPEEKLDPISLEAAYVDDGIMVNSGQFNGIPNKEAGVKITDYLASIGRGGEQSVIGSGTGASPVSVTGERPFL
jgi:leucyl-tRNA synthetase